jgi:hypothetical protein
MDISNQSFLGVAQGETLVPLRLIRDCCVPLDIIQENLQQTFARPYKSFNHLMRGSICIVGSGPSIHETYKHISGDVLACNAAHEFLIWKGIVPKYAMLWDAAEIVADHITPHKDVTYLVASRCHPAVFEKLKGFNVVVWHAASDGEGVMEHLEQSRRMEPVIQGGSAAVVRAMFMVLAMGYSDIKVFGCDGSFTGEHTHFRESAVPEKPIRVYCEKRWFDTTAWLAAQAEEVPFLFPIVSKLASIEVYGDGLIPHIAESLGYRVHKGDSHAAA